MHVADSVPYRWPWNGVGPADWAMLVIDQPFGPAGLTSRIAELANAVQATGGLLVRVRVHDPRSRAVPPAPQVTGPGLHVTAPGWNAFHESPLDSVLRRAGRHTLLLTGHWLEIAVHSTLRAANDRGYECATVSDLCAAFDPDLGRSALSAIAMSGGIFGAVLTSAAVLDALHSTPTAGPTAPDGQIERITR